MKQIIILLFLFISTSANAANNNFFNQSYRGWLWFEEKPKDEPATEQDIKNPNYIPTKEEMQRAKHENEEFKEELENLRHMMIRYPDNINYIKLYKEKEQEMLNASMTLARNFADRKSVV